MPRSNRPRFVALTERIKRTHPDVTHPADLIGNGDVIVDGVIVTNPAAWVRADAAIEWRRRRAPRGQVKLAAALTAFSVPLPGRTALDVGASTGGFTLALLEAGAKRVYAVDAGHGQLLGSLRNDNRVVNLENTNLADIGSGVVVDIIDVITADLSYLALADAAGQLERIDIALDADLVVLVKPMFELRLAKPPSDPVLLRRAVQLATAGIEQSGWTWQAAITSPVLGRRGAIEYLLHFRRYHDGEDRSA